MSGTFYVEVQPVDYDDYPRGSSTKIGPFDSEKDAEAFLTESRHFRGETYGGDKVLWWRKVNSLGNHTVYVKNLLDSYMINPDEYNERGY